MELQNSNQKLTLNARINEILSTEQGKTYTAAIATIIMVGLMIFFAIVPAYISITDQIALNDVKTKYLDEMNTKQTNISAMVQQEDQYTQAIKLFDVYFKEKINNEFLVASFSKVADDYKCKLTNMSFDKVFRSKNIKGLNGNVYAIAFNMTVSCKIADLNKFYQEVNNFPIPIYVSSITYTNKKDPGSGGSTGNLFFDKFNTTISGEYYFWNNPASGANIQLTTTN